MTDVAVLTREQIQAIVQDAVRQAIDSAGSSSDLPDVMTRADVAKLLQVTEHHVSKLHRSEGLPAHKLGGQYRYRRSEILAWVATRKGEK